MRVEDKALMGDSQRMFLLVLGVLLNPVLARADEKAALELDSKCESLISIGDYQGAYESARRSLQVREELARRGPVCLVPSHVNMALALLALGRVSAAIGEAEKARRLAAPEDRGRITYLMAKVHFTDRKYELAEQEFREVLSLPSGADRATVLNDLGMTVAALGRLSEARSLLAEAVAGPGNGEPAVRSQRGVSLANLALVDFRLGDLASAAKCYRAAIQAMEASFGPSHPYLGMALAEYSRVLRKSGAKAEAKAVERRAKDILASQTTDLMDRWSVDIRTLR